MIPQVLIKGERKISFDQFKEALQLLAQQKFPKDSQAISKLTAQIVSSSPSSSGTQAKATGIYSKLTDATLYPGTHKHRFDENGKNPAFTSLLET